MLWLLEPATLKMMTEAKSAGMFPNLEQQEQFEARYSAESDGGGPRLLTIAGDSAEIRVSGVITKTPNLFAALFGGGNVTYREIISAVDSAEQNDAIKSVTFAIDSPGGQFEGLFEAIDKIKGMNKPTKTIFGGVGASAAYALGVQADEVIAENRATRVGSVGVVRIMSVDDGLVEIASTDAPKKRPDPNTEEGRAIVREELDAMHSLFVDAIAGGRGVSANEINKNFGQGATVLAEEAKKRGMIDGIASSNVIPMKPPVEGKKKEVKAMDLKQLKAEHPDVYAAAVEDGRKQERDRVSAHLIAGEASGDMKTAVSSIKDGSDMTVTLQTQYMMAAANRSDAAARAADDAAAAAAASGAVDTDEQREANANSRLMAAAAELCGVELKEG